MNKKNYYDILGVKNDATESEIRKAYLKLAQKYHPDNKSTGNADKFKEINEANSVLSNKDKRSMYDRTGSADGDFGGFGNGSGFGEGGFGHGNFNFGDIFGNFGGGNSYHINFEDLFGGRSKPSKGNDLLIKISLSIQEAYTGVSKSFEIESQDKCNSCKNTQKARCNSCNGSGSVNFFLTCSKCNGEGYRYNCNSCNGNGFIKNRKKINIDIGAGVLHNQKIKFNGLGESCAGGPNGDLIAHIEVKNNTKFTLSDGNLVISCNINAFTLLTGTTITLNHIDGTVLSIKLPPGHGSNPLILKGKGFPYFGNKDRKGDLQINLHIINTNINTNDIAMIKTKFNPPEEIKLN